MGKSVHPSFEYLSAYRDGEPVPGTRDEIRAHLIKCSVCRNDVGAFDDLTLALATLPAVECVSARPLVSAQLDGEASPQEAAIAQSHLAACADCRGERARWSELELTLGTLPAGVPSPAADARIRGLARRPVRPAGPRFGGFAPVRALAAAMAGGFTPVRALVPVTVGAMVVLLAVLAALPGFAPAAPLVSAPLARDDGPVALVASISPQAILNGHTNTLYMLQPDSGVIVARDATTNAVVAEISVGGAPSALALNSVTNAVYVLDAAAKTVTEISGSTNSVVSTVAVPVTGRPTSLEVNAQNGKVVVASVARAGGDGSGQLVVIDSASRTVETVRTVDVSPIAVAVNARANHAYLLGAAATKVVDATTYATIETLPAAVAVAPSAIGSIDALLSDVAGGSRLTFFGSPARADLPGRAVTVVALPNGSFGALTDVDGKGRITLVGAGGEVLGSLAVATTARSLTFDSETLRFLGASGQAVAKIAQGAVVVATETPVPSFSTRPPPLAITSPPPTTAVAQPAAALPFILPPLPEAPIPGATVAAQGVYRLALAGHRVVAMAAADGDRIWFADQRGELLAVDVTSGRVSSLVQLQRDLTGARIVVGPRSLYVVDQAGGPLLVIDVASGRQTAVELPVRGPVIGIVAAGADRLWLATRGSASLIDFDVRTRQFTLVPLGAGTVVGALGADVSGRAWFADATRPASFFSYEPALRVVSEFASPAGGAITRIVADPTGQVWFGTASGELFAVNGGRISPVRLVGGPIQDLATAAAGTWFVAGDLRTTVGRAFGGPVVAGPSAARVVAVDGSGRGWVSGPSLDAFFVVEPR